MIVGTAGHVNHGKTRLVTALTGVDCDVLEEERRRGMTIQLGFAQWQLSTHRSVSIIDVPGHASFAHTMATGALGLDGVLVVVAADEGVMPQTREHLGACEVLGVRRCIVVVTRIDRMDDLELSLEIIADDLRGTIADGAPLVPVCAPDGRGLDRLREVALDTFDEADAGADADDGRAALPLLLPIDRVMTVKGFGTVVTGSHMRGTVAVGDSAVLYPARTQVRVRGLHVHGASIDHAAPSARLAVNLGGLEREAVERGDFISTVDGMCVGSVFDAELSWLRHNPKPLRNARSLGFVCGAVRAQARLHTDEPIAPGETGTGRVVLDREVPLVGGLRFVLRGAAHAGFGAVVGGGRVLDASPPRRRKGEVRVALCTSDAPASVLMREAGAAGVRHAELGARLGIAAQLGDAVTTDERVFDPEAMQRAQREVLAAVGRRGSQESKLGVGPITAPAIASLVGDGRLVRVGSMLHPHDAVPGQTDAQRALADAVFATIEQSGVKGPTESELLSGSAGPEREVREALRFLEGDGRIVRCNGVCFARPAVDPLIAATARAVIARGELPIAWLKDEAKVSRKHAMPLWTLMDREGVTTRRGDVRVAGPKAKSLAVES